MKHHRWGLACLLAASLLATSACGSDDGSDGGSENSTNEGAVEVTESAASAPSTPTSDTETTDGGSAEAPSDVDPQGVLDYGQNMLISVGMHFDPTKIRVVSSMTWLELVYGTLTRESLENPGTFEPYMAEDVEIIDPQTVRITMRPDVTFTDGSPYDAEAVKLSLERQRFENENVSGIHQGLLPLTGVDVIDPLTVEAHLDQPVAALFIESLASLPGIVHSPKQLAEAPTEIDTAPIGAGPYTVESFVPEQRIEMAKNPDFWDADSYQLAGINFVHTPPGTTQVNGLLADTIDYSTGIPTSSIDAVQADSDYSVDLQPVRFNTFILCSTKPPFDNELVRQALSMAIDRDAFNDLVYNGEGELAYGLYPSDHPSYDAEAEELIAYDPERARELIEESGVTDLAVEIVIVPSNAFDRQAEVLQSQLQEVGFETTIQPYENVYTDWIEPQKPGGMMTYQNGQPNGGWIHYSKMFVKGGSNAFCGSEDPEVMALVNEAVQLPADSPEAIDLYRQANLLYVEHALTIPIVFEPVANAWNSAQVGGTPAFYTDTADARLRFDSIYMKQQ